MKTNTLFLLAMVLMFFSACSKEEQEPLATFSFKINNGTEIKWEGPGGPTNACLLCGPRIFEGTTDFILASSAPEDYGRSISFTFNATEVNVATYNQTIAPDIQLDPISAPHVLYMDPLRGASTQPGDYATVTFTRIQSGKYYDGHFEAKITKMPYGAEDEKLLITGEFKNVPLYE